MLKCPWCDMQFEHEAFIARHSSRIHEKSRLDYELLVNHSSIRPTCACGCGTETTFHKGKFKKFIRGHQQRDPDVLAAMIKGGDASQRDDVRAKVARSIKSKWQDEKFRDKMLSVLKETQADRTASAKITWDTTDAREKLSIKMRNVWEMRRKGHKGTV